MIESFYRFARESLRRVLSGGKLYWAWVITLCVLIALGVRAYATQYSEGLMATSMRDQVSWAF